MQENGSKMVPRRSRRGIFSLLIFVFDFDAFGMAFWWHFASPNGPKLAPETEQNGCKKVIICKSRLGTVLQRSWGGPQAVLGRSWGGPGQPGAGSWAVLEAFWQFFELQKHLRDAKKKLERQKAAKRSEEQQW